MNGKLRRSWHELPVHYSTSKMPVAHTKPLSCAWALGIYIVSLIFSVETLRAQTDAVSREITVYNDLTNPVFSNNAVSRELTVYNDLVNPVEPTDAISREYTVFKFQQSITSNLPGKALAVTGALPDQLSELNAGPPPYNPLDWQAVHRKNTNQFTQFRCPQTPDPLDQHYLRSTLYLTGIDEVTLDNCGSAFYRFTFNVPVGAAAMRLRGVTTCDDQAVAFLNGNQISGTMTVPPCVPTGGANDPCYTPQDSGKDRSDNMGRIILTAPTPDLFEAADPADFEIGENELVFAVCGDAAYYEPTGLEFMATFEYDITNVSCDIVINEQPSDLAACPGGTLSLSVDASSGGTLFYQWLHDGIAISNDGRISGATSATLLIDPVQPADVGTYGVVLTTECDQVMSDAAVVTLRVPVSITQHPDDVITTPGNAAMFSAAAEGDAPISFRWRKDGDDLFDVGNISGATTATLNIDPVEASDAGTYDVRVINACGPVFSDTAQLIVRGHRIERSVIVASGAVAGSARHKMQSTLGEPVVGTATSARHELRAGFWAPLAIAVLPGDVDGDGDVDLADYAVFAECLFGPETIPAPMLPLTSQECLSAFDLDGDGDIDLADFARFNEALTS